MVASVKKNWTVYPSRPRGWKLTYLLPFVYFAFSFPFLGPPFTHATVDSDGLTLQKNPPKPL